MGGSSQGPGGIREGDILAGKYRVEQILGVGGMGVVVAARHLKLDDRVAIKLLVPDARLDPDALVRFEREARAAVKIKSDHVVRVTDVGTLENGAPYMVMEYLEGEDLATCLRREGTLPILRTVEFVLQACDAIGEAHSLGIIHRDIKPANLFCALRSDGRSAIKVLDFGILKLTSFALTTRGMDMTRVGAMMGSPLYMSPEQMQSPRTVDRRTDIWGIGIVLYELLVGDVPFTGETITEVCLNVTSQPTPLVRRLRPDSPAGLDAVISKCLEKDRNKRFANIGELALALAPFGSRRAREAAARIARNSSSLELSGNVSISNPPPESSAQSSSRSATDSPWGHTRQRPIGKRRRSSFLAMGAVLVVGLVGSVTAVTRRSNAPSSMAPNSLAIAPLHPSPATSPPRPPAQPIPAPTSISPPVLPTPVPERASKPLAPPTRAAADGVRPSSRALPPPLPATEVRGPAPAATRCMIDLISIPPANVMLDGLPLGTTPLLGISALAGPLHKVVFTHAGEREQATVTCQPGEVKRVAVRFNSSPDLDEPERNPYR